MPNLMQLPLFDSFDKPYLTKSAAVKDAVEKLASHSGIEARGAVFTRIEVVEFILDLVGYTENHPLCSQRILEPSFGGGDFLHGVERAVRPLFWGQSACVNSASIPSPASSGRCCW